MLIVLFPLLGVGNIGLGGRVPFGDGDGARHIDQVAYTVRKLTAAVVNITGPSATVAAPACDSEPETGLQVNGLGTYHILEAARLFGVGQVIFASSLSVLSGAYATEPTVNDFSVTRPDFIYGAAKLLSENVGLFFKRQYGLDYRGLRLPNVVGPDTVTHGYLEYFNKAIEETARGRPYSIYVEPDVRIPVMYVDDVARAFVKLARAPLSAIKTVNYTVLGPTPSPTAQELVDTLQSKVPGAQLDFTVD